MTPDELAIVMALALLDGRAELLADAAALMAQTAEQVLLATATAPEGSKPQ